MCCAAEVQAPRTMTLHRVRLDGEHSRFMGDDNLIVALQVLSQAAHGSQPTPSPPPAAEVFDELEHLIFIRCAPESATPAQFVHSSVTARSMQQQLDNECLSTGLGSLSLLPTRIQQQFV